MKHEILPRLAGAFGGLIVGGFLGSLVIALVLSSLGRPTNIQNILPLSLACAIVCGIAGFFVKSIGKAFLRIMDTI
mgnify:CR=1 FL=1